MHDVVGDLKPFVYPYARSDSAKPIVNDEWSIDSFAMWQSVGYFITPSRVFMQYSGLFLT